MKTKTIIVTDNYKLRTQLVHFLKVLEVQIVLLEINQDIFTLLFKYRPELVILDMDMTVIDPCEVLESAKSVINSYVLGLSSKYNAESINQAYELQIDKYIYRPLSLKELVKGIRNTNNRIQFASSPLEMNWDEMLG